MSKTANLTFESYQFFADISILLGILPLVFENSSDYDKIQPSDTVSLLGLKNLSPGKVSHDVLSYIPYTNKYQILIS